MQLIDCDAAINFSCNRSVLDSNPSTDRRRWVFKGCRWPCVFFPRCGNALIPILAFPCARSPHLPRASSLRLLLLSLNRCLCPPLTSKGADQSAGCPFFLRTAVATEQIGWCLFLSCVKGIKCDISLQAAALLVWNYDIDWPNCRLWSSSWVSGDNGGRIIHYSQTENHLRMVIMAAITSMHGTFGAAQIYVALFTPAFERCWRLMLP